MARTRKNCGFEGCRKQQINGSAFCVEHALRAPEVYPAPKKAPLPVLTALCAAVAAKYKEEGDKIKAGVVVAELSHGPPARFYASVARYPHNPMHKEVVCKVGHNQPILSAEDAVLELAQRWAEENRPAPVKETIEELDLILSVQARQ